MFTAKKGKTVTPVKEVISKGRDMYPSEKLFFIMPSISLTSLCSFAQLQENSISHLSSVVLCKEFAVSLYR